MAYSDGFQVFRDLLEILGNSKQGVSHSPSRRPVCQLPRVPCLFSVMFRGVHILRNSGSEIPVPAGLGHILPLPPSPPPCGLSLFLAE